MECLRHPAETANKFVYVSSIATTQNEIVAALEKAQGVTYEKSSKSSEARLQEAREALSKGDFSGAVNTVKTVCVGNVPGTNQHFETTEKDRLFNDVLNIPRTSLEETVQRAMKGL